VIKKRLFRFQKMVTPDSEPPAGQMKPRIELGVQALVEQAVFRLQEQALYGYF
jgi:hypothetical protein